MDTLHTGFRERYVRLLEFPGQRQEDSTKYFYKGRFFHRDTRPTTKTPTYHCADRGKSRCHMVLKGKKPDPSGAIRVDPLLVKEVEDSHSFLCRRPDHLYPMRTLFRAALVRSAKTCARKLKTIFDEELNRKDE